MVSRYAFGCVGFEVWVWVKGLGCGVQGMVGGRLMRVFSYV